MLHLGAIFSLHDTILRHSKGVLRWMVSTLLLLRKLGMARLPLVMQDCCSLSCTSINGILNGIQSQQFTYMMPPLVVSWLVDECVDHNLANMSMIIPIVRQLTWKGMPHGLDDQCKVCLSLITC